MLAVKINNLNHSINNQLVLKNINFNLEKDKIACILGPSGCGKSTFIRCINRMNDVIENCKVEGSIFFDKTNIYESFKR